MANQDYGSGFTPKDQVVESEVVPYETPLVLDTAKSLHKHVTVSDGNIFTVECDPAKIPEGRLLFVTLKNTSGGAMGAITWTSGHFALNSAFTGPATGNTNTIAFIKTGGKWRELFRATATTN